MLTTSLILRPEARAWVRTHLGLLALLVLPFVVVGIPRLFGLAYLTGDNFIQNFPMRVLVGRTIDHGSLPLWNSYLFSGTPLLAGFNAGAAYPATWLMALLDIFTAWALTLALLYDVALLGMYLFLRRQGISSHAATFGAAVFAFAGYLTGQMVHIDLIEGAIWLPWMLLAVQGLTERPGAGPPGQPTARPLRLWAGLLALSVGLSVLSGGVEAFIDSLIVATLYFAARLVSMDWLRRDHRRNLVAPLVATALGAAGGAMLSAAQWLPGLAFISESQRAVRSYGFFTSGSLEARLITLLASPFVEGTNRNWAPYFGTYNFPEVTSYMGILALIAACSLFLRRFRQRPEARHWWVWYPVIVLGVLSAFGRQTPFGHLIYLIPGVNNQRLLNRNLLLVDVALAVLFGWWCQLVLGDRAQPEGHAPGLARRWRAGPRSELVVPAIPFLIVTVICLTLWIDGPLLYRWLEVPATVAVDTRVQLALLLTGGVALAGAATWIVLSQRRFSARTFRHLLAAVLAVDLIVFNLLAIVPPISEAQAQAQTGPAAALRALTGDGRFIIYDPDELDTAQLYAVGQTDLNIFTGVRSAQGYTALTDGAYYRATGSHLQETLNPTTLGGSVWDRLNVTSMLSLPAYFVVRIPGPVNQPTARPGAVVSVPTGLARPASTPAVTLAAGRSHDWYFGGLLTVSRASVPVGPGSSTGLRVGLVAPSGAVRWVPAGQVRLSGGPTDRTLRVALAHPTRAGGLVVEAGAAGPASVGLPTATTAEAGTVRLAGPLQTFVQPPHWVFAGDIGGFGAFVNSRAGGWAGLRTPGGGRAPIGNSVRVGPTGPDGGQTLTVHATAPLVLERSESFSPGWQATVQVRSGGTGWGPPRSVPVRPDGIVQQVTLPGPGDFLVTFSYAPRSALVGVAVSSAAALGLFSWGAVEAVRARRRRSAPTPGPRST